MTKSKILVLAAAPALLCGCATKCSFQDFQKKVEEISELKVASRIVLKGTLKDGKNEYSISYDSENPKAEDLLNGNMIAAAVMAFNGVGLYAIEEDTNATYYAGSSFRVKTEILDIEWNGYGACTKAKGELKGETGKYTVDLNASYTYDK